MESLDASGNPGSKNRAVSQKRLETPPSSSAGPGFEPWWAHQAPVYEADTQAGSVSFITMELIEGRPLSELIPKGGLDLARLFELAI